MSNPKKLKTPAKKNLTKNIEDLSEASPLRWRQPFSQTHPEIALEWHYGKNCGFGPEDFSFGANVAVWWQCSATKTHEWRTRINHRTKFMTACPMCKNRKVAEDNSLLALYPRVAKEFHPTKNKQISPSKILAVSTQKVWWQCLINPKHTWRGQVLLRTVRGAGCPGCRGDITTTNKKLAPARPSPKWIRVANMVPEIIKQVENGRTYTEVATALKISASNISKIMINHRGRVKKWQSNDEEDRASVQKLIAAGNTYVQISEKLGISRYRVGMWANSKAMINARKLKPKKRKI